MNSKQLDRLFRDMKEGDGTAFEEIYEQTRKTVYAFILTYTMSRADADDATQDTYIRVMRSISHYEVGTNAMAWLLQVAKNTALNLLRKKKREIPTDFAANEVKFGTYVLDTDDSVMGAIVKCLTAEEQQIVILHSVAGYKHREIAVITEKPLGTVTWTYKNAVKKLNTALRGK